MRLDDDLGRAREHRLGRHLKALPLHVGERVLTAGHFDKVVQESHARADEDVAQRSRLRGRRRSATRGRGRPATDWRTASRSC